MIMTYTAKLDLKVEKTDVDNQKIDSFSLEIYSIVIAAFQIFNKLS